MKLTLFRRKTRKAEAGSIRPQSRLKFETLGLALVRIDMPMGVFIQERTERLEAIAWIQEQEKALAEERNSRHRSTVTLAAVGAGAGLVAAVAGIIAAWPTVLAWLSGPQ